MTASWQAELQEHLWNQLNNETISDKKPQAIWRVFPSSPPPLPSHYSSRLKPLNVKRTSNNWSCKQPNEEDSDMDADCSSIECVDFCTSNKFSFETMGMLTEATSSTDWNKSLYFFYDPCLQVITPPFIYIAREAHNSFSSFYKREEMLRRPWNNEHHFWTCFSHR